MHKALQRRERSLEHANKKIKPETESELPKILLN